jgi:carnitine 3-dehydrogenase
MIEPAAVRRIAVLGAGTIGGSWVAWFLARGMQVTVWDPRGGGRRSCAELCDRRLASYGASGHDGRRLAGCLAGLRHRRGSRSGCRIHSGECARADGHQARTVWRADPVISADAVLASSTSGLIMSEMQAGLRSAARFVVGHPFNPPHLIPLVEVVGGRETASETIAWCLDFYRHIGKRPIHIRKEAPGHLANPLQAALWREAVNAVVSGLASVEDVDTAISAGPGLRWAVMGPHMTFHLGGGEGGITHMLEQFTPAFEAWWASMTTPELSEETCRKIIDGLAEAARKRSISELVRERDELLIPLLELVAKRRTSH